MTDEYLEEFARESEEDITELNNALLAFEDDPTDEAAMDRIFRTAHTLKGNCGAMGFDPASDLAHAIEDLLESIRARRVEVTPELMDAIFDGVDLLEGMIGEAVQYGEVRTDPTTLIESLREHAAAPGLTAPTDDEVEAVLERVAARTDSDHGVYHVRLEVAGEPASHGPAIVDALDDAFDLLGTAPDGDRIDDGDYDGTFDAVFASVVERSAVEAALDPVDAVENHVVTDVTDRLEAGGDETDATAAAADTAGTSVPDEDVEDVSVEELLADEEVDQYDDLEGLAEQVEDTEGLEDLGDAGSFDDLDLGDDVGSPTSAADADGATADDETDGATADDAGADAAEVQDASSEFQQLKEEVDPVGFDELQEEIEELEFDEYDSDDEVGFDELLGDEVLEDDGAFADDGHAEAADAVETEASQGAVDSAVEAGDAEEPTDETGSDAEDVGETDDVAEAADETDDVAEAADEADDVAEAADEADDVAEAADETDDVTEAADEAGDPADEIDDVAEDTVVSADAPAAGDDPGAEEAADADAAATDADAEAADADAAATDADAEAADADAAATDADAETADAVGPGERPGDDTDDAAQDVAEAVDDGLASADDGDEAASAATDDAAPDAEVASADGDDGATGDDADAAESHSEGFADHDVDAESGTVPAAEDDEDDAVPVEEAADLSDDSFDDVSADDRAVDADQDVERVDGFGEEGSVLDLDGDETAVAGDEVEAVEGETPAGDDGTVSTGDGAAATDDETATADDETATADDGAAAGDEAFEFADDGASDEPATDADDAASSPETADAPDAGATVDGDETADSTDVEGPSSADDLLESVDGPDAGASDASDLDVSDIDVSDVGDVDLDSSDLATAATGFTASGSADQSRSDPTVRYGEPVVESVDEDRAALIRSLGVAGGDDEEDAGGSSGQSIRVQVEQLDRMLNLVEELVTSRARLRRALAEDEPRQVLDDELEDLEDVTSELQETVMDVRLVPLRTAVNKLPRIVRDVAREQDKEVDFEMVGEDVELDRSILEEIGDPLVHLVRNAVDHGIEPPEERAAADKPETGSVELRARRERDRVFVTVEDDGGGIDADEVRDAAVEEGVRTREAVEAMDDEAVYDLLFESGLSTAEEVTDVSGRGVGMDVVGETVAALDGTVSVESEPGEGTTVQLELPVTLAIAEVLFVEVGDEEYGVPVKVVDEVGPVVGLETQDGQEVLVSDGGEAERDLLRLNEELNTDSHTESGSGMLVHLRDDVREATLLCDAVRGQQEVVVKPFEGVLEDVTGLSGATVLGDGDVVPILDVETL